MTKPLRLGIAGLGTVGVGVIKIIQNNLSLLEARAGKQILISSVTAEIKICFPVRASRRDSLF